MKFEYLNSKGARGDVRRQHKCIPHVMYIAVFTDTYRPSTALQSDTICMDQTMSYLFDTATRLWACVRPILPYFNCAYTTNTRVFIPHCIKQPIKSAPKNVQ